MKGQVFRWLTRALQCQNLLGFSVFLQRQFNQTVSMASNPSLSNAFTFWRQQHNVFQVACYQKQKTTVIPFNWKLRGINNTEFEILITSLFISAFSVSRLKKAVLVWHLKLYFTNQEFRNRTRKIFCELPRFEFRSVSYDLAWGQQYNYCMKNNKG